MLSPDQVSFSSVLSACANIGVADSGKQVHGVAVKHGVISLAYVKNSLMDMYFKCGSSSDGTKLFKTIGDKDVVTLHSHESMPIKPHALVWGALLGACKSHGDLEMGREVAGKLFEIEPHNPGNYILLSNMYSLVRGKRKAKQLDSRSDEEDKEEQTSDEEVSKGIIEADTISNPPKKLKTKTLVGRKPIEVTSSSVAKASRERHAQSQYEIRVLTSVSANSMSRS
ncbi:hypothetical protein RHMOL_Rhmol01G0302400 [Rhododendron molle]|uniref:Uncharacterized protein n=1 Tax=Rhododendron molle TaxID=49168 RepID=A0ACC0QAB9_RHOML|nr:hypothetical protein RHMOL_Rhmol01G0302400 [Rhododendron molle]